MLSKSQLYFQFSRRPFKFVQIQPLFVLIVSVSVIFEINWEYNGGLEQIWRAYVKIENIAEINSQRTHSTVRAVRVRNTTVCRAGTLVFEIRHLFYQFWKSTTISCKIKVAFLFPRSKMLFACICVILFAIFQTANVFSYPWHASCEIKWWVRMRFHIT